MATESESELASLIYGTMMQKEGNCRSCKKRRCARSRNGNYCVVKMSLKGQ